MNLKLHGKIVLVTGSTRGVGWANDKALAAEGCRIMLSDALDRAAAGDGNGLSSNKVIKLSRCRK